MTMEFKSKGPPMDNKENKISNKQMKDILESFYISIFE